MQLDSRLQKSRHGIYYLRIQQHGLDRRWSLRTRDPHVAAIHAHELSVTLLRMKNITHSGWSMKVDGDKIEITTEDNDADRTSAKAVIVEIVKAQAQASLTLAQVTTPLQSSNVNPNHRTITLEDALKEYELVLEESELALKSKKMASSVLAGLMRLLGTAFNVYWCMPDQC